MTVKPHTSTPLKLATETIHFIRRSFTSLGPSNIARLAMRVVT